jgi:DNA-directed RNA polymerase specialized sigma24 family protein
MSQGNPSINSAAIQALIPELRVAARVLVNGSAIAPDDLVQDALMVALRNWHQLPSGDGLKPWLLGVLRDHDLVERVEQLGTTPAERG